MSPADDADAGNQQGIAGRFQEIDARARREKEAFLKSAAKAMVDILRPFPHDARIAVLSMVNDKMCFRCGALQKHNNHCSACGDGRGLD